MKKYVFIIFLLVILSFLLLFLEQPISLLINKNYKASIPKVDSTWHNKEIITKGDIYVSTNGDDNASGDRLHPFKTIQRAQEAVKTISKLNKDKIVVCIESGEYRIDSLFFDSTNSGDDDCPIIYTALKNDDVLISGGIKLSLNDFLPVSDYLDIISRIDKNATNYIKVLDLKKEPYSLNKDDYGLLYPIGTYNTIGEYEKARKNVGSMPKYGYSK